MVLQSFIAWWSQEATRKATEVGRITAKLLISGTKARRGTMAQQRTYPNGRENISDLVPKGCTRPKTNLIINNVSDVVYDRSNGYKAVSSYTQ